MTVTENTSARLIKAEMHRVHNTPAGIVSEYADGGFLWQTLSFSAGTEDVLHVQKAKVCYVIPIVGSVKVIDSKATELIAHAEEILQLSEGVYRIKNLLEYDRTNLLIVWLDVPASYEIISSKAAVPLLQKNTLVQCSNFCHSVQLGFFDSRTKYSLEVLSASKNTLAYVVNGSFELEERLLEYRDVLVMQGYSKIEFESLSENAIIILIT